jgi:parallel beta-helix repeat protein
MRRLFWILLPLFAPLLTPTDAWEASVSQNLAITVTTPPPPPPVTSAFFIATNGSDSNPGTLAAPFATFAKCQMAMRGSPTVKTCYIRAGTYTPPRFTGTGEICLFDNGTDGSGHYADGTRPGAVVALTSSDNGETWRDYPPDESGWTNGVSTVIIDGGSTAGQSGDQKNGSIVGSANGIGCGFTLNSASNITIMGLQFQRFVWSAVWGVDSPGFLFQNNTVHNTTGAAFVAGAVAGVGFGANVSLNWQIKNNYFHDLAYTATEIVGETTASTSGITVSGNFITNVCTWASGGSTGNDQDGGDCGGIYFEDSNGTPGQATNIQVLNNYVQDLNTSSNGAGDFSSCCAVNVYLDNDASNATVSGNVLIGNKSGGVLVHGGSNNIITGNLIDLDFPSALGNNIWNVEGSNNGVLSGTGNTIHNNIFTSNSSNSGAGFLRSGSMPAATVTNNFYHGYGSATIATSGGFGTDTNPVQPGSLSGTPINCWAATIAAGSQPTASPVNFPAGLVGGGGWGPPGFMLPQTGTAPSWPHAC